MFVYRVATCRALNHGLYYPPWPYQRTQLTNSCCIKQDFATSEWGHLDVCTVLFETRGLAPCWSLEIMQIYGTSVSVLYIQSVVHCPAPACRYYELLEPNLIERRQKGKKTELNRQRKTFTLWYKTFFGVSVPQIRPSWVGQANTSHRRESKTGFCVCVEDRFNYLFTFFNLAPELVPLPVWYNTV